jgi:hypothetical protein
MIRPEDKLKTCSISCSLFLVADMFVGLRQFVGRFEDGAHDPADFVNLIHRIVDPASVVFDPAEFLDVRLLGVERVRVDCDLSRSQSYFCVRC